MRTEFMLLAIYNKPRLDLDETCQALGISTATGYTHRSRGKFPVVMSGIPLTADIRDVAAALDKIRGVESANLSEAGEHLVHTMRQEIDRLANLVQSLDSSVSQLRLQLEQMPQSGLTGRPRRHLRLPAVIALVGLKRTAIYRRMKEGSFPQPIQLGARAVAWDAAAIAEWQRERPDGVKTYQATTEPQAVKRGKA